nr:hypothetical protein [Candidatus Sigynarchaeota archaeon]
MAPTSTSVFVWYLIIFGAVVGVLITNFAVIPMTSAPQGFFIMPGNLKTEWVLAIFLIPAVNVGAGMLASFAGTGIFASILFSRGKKTRAVYLASTEPLPVKALARQIFSRALILGLFSLNLAYTAASQEFIVDFWRSAAPTSMHSLPDPEVMLQLVWIAMIPSAIFIVPIWCINDAGIAESKKQDGLALTVTQLAGTNLYRFVKGYIGITFVFNLGYLIASWVLPFIWSTGFSWFLIVVQFTSPFLVICMLIPLPIILALLRGRLRGFIERIARQSGFNEKKNN